MTNSDKIRKRDSEALDLYYDGWKALQEGNLSLAYTYFMKSIGIKPHFKTHEVLYSLLIKLNRLEEAFAQIEKAFRLNPKNNRTATIYAGELFNRNEVNESQQILFDILKRSNSYGPAERLLKIIEKAAD